MEPIYEELRVEVDCPNCGHTQYTTTTEDISIWIEEFLEGEGFTFSQLRKFAEPSTEEVVALLVDLLKSPTDALTLADELAFYGYRLVKNV